MPKRVKELTAIEVKRLEYPHEEMQAKGNKLLPVFKAVGGVAGLHLQLTAGDGRSWIFRYAVEAGKDRTGAKKYKRRSLGLGGYPEVSLAEARERAKQAKIKLREGTDPIKDRRAARAALAAELAKPTFAEVIDEWDRANPNKFRSTRHRKAWLASVRGLDGLQHLRVDQIDKEDIWRALSPVADRTLDTAKRTRGRIVDILNWAIDRKYRTGRNPADKGWVKRKLKEVAENADVKVTQLPDLQVEEVSRFWAALRKLEGNGSRALEFLMLTAARSGEVRGAVWSEIDLDKALWTVPAERMKMSRDHAVPLPTVAVELLKALPRENELVFPAARGGEMSDMTISATMKRMHVADLKAGGAGFFGKGSDRPAVPHGMRSTFRQWAAQNAYSREHAELALAHKFGTQVEQVYQRDTLIEQRRPMMEAWAAHIEGREPADNVLEMRRG